MASDFFLFKAQLSLIESKRKKFKANYSVHREKIHYMLEQANDLFTLFVDKNDSFLNFH